MARRCTILAELLLISIRYCYKIFLFFLRHMPIIPDSEGFPSEFGSMLKAA